MVLVIVAGKQTNDDDVDKRMSVEEVAGQKICETSGKAKEGMSWPRSQR